MARKRRYHFPGMFYHIMLRGNEKRDIFFSDADRKSMAFLLMDGVKKFEHKIHAFCFMNNHIHLLLQVCEIPASTIMHNLSSRYSQKINRKYKRIGHLFQGRYKAILIEEDKYFMRLLRYIHLNPVRSKIVTRPEEYSWSSHNSYLGKNHIDWLTVEYGLSKFSKSEQERLKAYSDYIDYEESSHELEEFRKGFNDGQILGSEDFITRIKNLQNQSKKKNLQLSNIVQATCELIKVNEELIKSSLQIRALSFGRGLISVIAKMVKIPTQEIATFMNRDTSTISTLVLRFHALHGNSEETQALLKKIIEKSSELSLSEF